MGFWRSWRAQILIAYQDLEATILPTSSSCEPIQHRPSRLNNGNGLRVDGASRDVGAPGLGVLFMAVY